METTSSDGRNTASLLAFSIACFIFTYLIQRLQGVLPLNPQGSDRRKHRRISPSNTAVSFATNTIWQAYGGNNAQLFRPDGGAHRAELCRQPPASRCAIALVRGFARQQALIP
jgi:K+-transporting ATPase ATPase A chain